MTKRVELFGGKTGGVQGLGVEMLGHKGSELTKLAAIGLPVPPGFIVTTDFCRHCLSHDGSFPDVFHEQISRGLAHIEANIGTQFASVSNPLLVSVRASPLVPLPGMLDGVLNLGLNDESVEGLAIASGASFAWDSYRRLILNYADAVLKLDRSLFEEALEVLKEDKGVFYDFELGASDFRELTRQYRSIFKRESGEEFFQDSHEQLRSAIAAVFNSSQSDRAQVYRRLNRIPDNLGVAVVVQAMVFGNVDDDSAVGVASSRNPSSGAIGCTGEYLPKAMGWELWEGIRTPQHVTRAERIDAEKKALSMEELMPEAFSRLLDVCAQLEAHFRDMVEVTFCVERGKLWLLAARPARRTVQAAIRVAVDLLHECIISESDAVARVPAQALRAQLLPRLREGADRHPLTHGLPASPGVAAGRIALDADTAERMSAQGIPVILVRVEVNANDVPGMHASKGILTTRGGLTSHAAVVARGMGRPCVSGAAAIEVDRAGRSMRIHGREFHEGTTITIDGSSGLVVEGDVSQSTPTVSPEARRLVEIADRLNGQCGAWATDLNEILSAQAFRRTDIYVASSAFHQSQLTADEQTRDDRGAAQKPMKIAKKPNGHFPELVRAAGGARLTIVIDSDEYLGDYMEGPLPRRRNGIALNPVAFYDTLARLCAGIVAGATNNPGTKFRIALSGIMHANDFTTCKSMLAEIGSKSPLPHIELVGLIDSPYALLFCNRLFEPVTALVLDAQRIGENLYLQTSESLATYQDIGEIAAPASRGGVFEDVLWLVKASPLNGWKSKCGGEVGAIIPWPCDSGVWGGLQQSGVSSLIFPSRKLPEALTTLWGL